MQPPWSAPELRPPRSCPLPRGAGSEKPSGYTQFWQRPATQRLALLPHSHSREGDIGFVVGPTRSLQHKQLDERRRPSRLAMSERPVPRRNTRQPSRHPVAPGHTAQRAPTPGVDKRDSREKENRAKQRSIRTRSLRACNYSADLMP